MSGVMTEQNLVHRRRFSYCFGQIAKVWEGWITSILNTYNGNAVVTSMKDHVLIQQ